MPLQYNPAMVQRSFAVAATTSGAGAGQRAGAPVETVQIEVELDASKRASRDTTIVAARIAAIVGLVSPRAEDVKKNLDLAAQGMIEILPPEAPLVLFVYGPTRVQPVVLTEIALAEEAHAPDLSPIRARISLGMQVLRYADLPAGHVAHALSLANQVARESLAAEVSGGEAAAAIARGTLESL
ncbi:MAG: hypothetical protein ACE37F_19535 [Nannocystaceae bacterium]